MKTAKKHSQVHRRKVHRKPAQTQAIMRIPAPPNRPWQLNEKEISLVKNYIAKGCTDEELEFCINVARRYRLDPFRQQIFFVPRKEDGDEGKKNYIPIVGINGMLHVAARDHKDFGSVDEPEFGTLHKVSYQYRDKRTNSTKTGTIDAPEWARVKVWKKGFEHPTVCTVYWDEIYPNIDYAPLVRRMPKLMLGKCATAAAIRRAYPATDGLYLREEFQDRPEEFTEGGRQIVYPESQTTPRRSRLASGVQQEPRCDGCGKAGHLMDDCADKHCYRCGQKGHWAKDCPQNGAPATRPASQAGHSQQASKPAEKQAQAAQGSAEQAHTASKPQKPDEERKSAPIAKGVDFKGSLKNINSGVREGTPHQTFRKITFYESEDVHFLFDNKKVRILNRDRQEVEMTWFDILAKAPLGTVIVCKVTEGKYKNITSISRIGVNEWEPDGTPIIQRDAELFEEREPGSEG